MRVPDKLIKSFLLCRYAEAMQLRIIAGQMAIPPRFSMHPI